VWNVDRGYHEYSFAYATMGQRLPTILGKAIDDTVRTLNERSDEEEITDLVQCEPSACLSSLTHRVHRHRANGHAEGRPRQQSYVLRSPY
jgi:hypothetical protein